MFNFKDPLWNGPYDSSSVYWREPNWINPELVSVIVTCHGKYGTFIEKCLQSIYIQTYPNIEILFIDDGTENLPDLSFSKIKYYKVDFMHANKSRNFGFSKSKGKFVIFLDVDDWFYDKSVVSKFVYYSKEASIVAGQFQQVGAQMELIPFGFPQTFDRERLLHCNYIQTTALIRRKDFLGFNENLQQSQDWELWVRSVLAGKKFAYLAEPVIYHHIHSGNMEKSYIIKDGKRLIITQEEYKDNYRKVAYDTMLLTIATSFSGKEWCVDKYFKRLSELKFPKNRTRLLFFDDSNSKKFSKLLHKKIKKIRPKYASCVLLSGGVLPVAYEPYAVSVHMAKIYNRMRPEMMKGTHCFIWEDDELPPKDVIECLSRHLWHNVGLVSGYSKSRQRKTPLVWYWQNGLIIAFPNGKKAEDVGAVSLGCALIPSVMIKRIMFKPYGNSEKEVGHDIVFSRDLARLNFRIIVDWTVQCLHLDRRGIITPKIKLHLGCGYRYLPDYVNIDKNAGYTIDEQLDLTHSLPYPDNSVDLIETHHLIEHLPTHLGLRDYKQEFLPILKDWFRVLKTDGKIIIECPDFDALITLYVKRPSKREQLMQHIYGFGSNEGDYHHFGWNFTRLKNVLQAAGFMHIKKKKARDYHAKQSPCLRVEAVKQ